MLSFRLPCLSRAQSREARPKGAKRGTCTFLLAGLTCRFLGPTKSIGPRNDSAWYEPVVSLYSALLKQAAVASFPAAQTARTTPLWSRFSVCPQTCLEECIFPEPVPVPQQ